MAHDDGDANCPAVIAGPPHLPAGRVVAGAAFLSQLIAERRRLGPQRRYRRAAPAEAAGSYASGLAMAVRRIPTGYRTTLIC